MRTLLRPAAIVDAWFDMLPPGREATMRELRALVMGTAPELQQVVKWGNLVFSAGGSHAFALVAHKRRTRARRTCRCFAAMRWSAASRSWKARARACAT
jgi:hypothetical protein